MINRTIASKSINFQTFNIIRYSNNIIIEYYTLYALIFYVQM